MAGDRREPGSPDHSSHRSETGQEIEETVEQSQASQGADGRGRDRLDRETDEPVKFKRPFERALPPGRDDYSQQAFYESRKKTLRARKAKR